MVAYPKDWEKNRLDNFVYIYQGGTPSTANKAYWDGNIVWVTPSDVTKQSDLYIYDSDRKITEEGLINSSATLLPKGAILLCTRATIGELAIAGRPLATNQGFKNLVCRPNTDSTFLAYLLGTYEDEMLKKASGTTFLELSSRELSKIKVLMPPLHEQRAIAEVISDFDNHLKNLTKLIEKKKAIRDGALEDLVTGKTRLDGFEDEWEICRIETLTKQIITGGTPSTSEDKYWGGAIPWLSSTEIHQKRIMNPTSYITESGLKNSSAKMAPPCSVIVALAGQGKTRGTVAVLEREMALNQSLAAMVANDNTDFMFLYYALENGYEDLRELSSGDGGRGGLNKKILRDFEVKVPPCKDEQQAIASILTAMDEEINSLEQEKNKIIQLKEGAMDDLLTGRVRLV